MPTSYEQDHPPKTYLCTHPLQLQVSHLSLTFLHSLFSLNPSLMFSILTNNGGSPATPLPTLTTPGSPLQQNLWSLLTIFFSTLQQATPPCTTELSEISSLLLKIQPPADNPIFTPYSFTLNIFEQALLHNALDRFSRFGMTQLTVSIHEPLFDSNTFNTLPIDTFCNLRDTASHLLHPITTLLGYSPHSSAGIGSPLVPLVYKYAFELRQIWSHRPSHSSMRYTSFPLPPPPTTHTTPHPLKINVLTYLR